MKEAIVKYAGTKYKIHALGFFAANRLLLKTLGPIVSALGESGGSISEDKSFSLVAKVMQQLDPDLVEDALKKLLYKVTADGEVFKAEDIEDYELAVELITEAVKLNYSSLGKILAKLKSLQEPSQE